MRRLWILVLVLFFILFCLVSMGATIHEGTGPRTDAGGNINNLSGIVYAPEYGKFLGIRQNNTIYVYDPETMSNGHERTVLLTGCAGNDKESITMIDPWAMRGHDDVLFIMDEDQHTLCQYSVVDILDYSSAAAAQAVWDLDSILPSCAYDMSEGLLFLPDDPDCPNSLYGGCFIVNLHQAQRTLHKVQLTPEGQVEAIGATFKVDDPCGWSSGGVQDMNYDWRNEHVYVLNAGGAYSHTCVLDKSMTQYVGVSPFPCGWKYEGFAWGAGYVVWSNDNDAHTGQMISFQEDAYSFCELDWNCDGKVDFSDAYDLQKGGIYQDWQLYDRYSGHLEYGPWVKGGYFHKQHCGVPGDMDWDQNGIINYQDMYKGTPRPTNADSFYTQYKVYTEWPQYYDYFYPDSGCPSPEVNMTGSIIDIPGGL